MKGSWIKDLPDQDSDWKRLGLCRSYGIPDLWFPEGSDWEEHAEEAKRVCRTCPMLRRCGEAAEANDEQWGIWAAVHRRPADKAKKRTVA